VPVLTSQVSSMPEVAGDAALYCDPEDALSIAAGIMRLLDTDTATRLVERGRERLTQFSWQRTAEAMCRVYELCVTGTRSVQGADEPAAPRRAEKKEVYAECPR
jgi:glycosyltransferase involved in cell wall biosynthesis